MLEPEDSSDPSLWRRSPLFGGAFAEAPGGQIEVWCRAVSDAGIGLSGHVLILQIGGFV